MAESRIVPEGYIPLTADAQIKQYLSCSGWHGDIRGCYNLPGSTNCGVSLWNIFHWRRHRDGNPALREVVAEINEEHTAQINGIKSSNPHDEVALTGSKTPWKGVLAIYSVMATTNPDNPIDAITLDESRQKLLRQVFREMSAIEHRVEEREFTEIELVDDGDSNVVEPENSSVKKTLYITLSNKPIDDMAAYLCLVIEKSTRFMNFFTRNVIRLDSRFFTASVVGRVTSLK